MLLHLSIPGPGLRLHRWRLQQQQQPSALQHICCLSFWTKKVYEAFTKAIDFGGKERKKGAGGGETGVFPLLFQASTFARVLTFVLSCHMCLAECPYQCDCKWKGGKETVECQRGGYYMVPSGLPKGTQVLDLSDNNLQVLPKDSFVSVGLIHLQRIYLRQCSISQVDKEAFRSLMNLVELDLSNNHLTYVPSWAFREAPQLRRLYLNHNPLNQLQNDAFADLQSLEMLELSHCHLLAIHTTAFQGLERLSKLRLDGNMLQDLSDEVVASLASLQELHLHDNPWKCDCHLRSLKEWMALKNVPVRAPPSCALPKKFRGQMWSELSVEDYACEPKITLETTSLDILEGDNVTIGCHVTGDPEPTVWWLRQGVPITNASEAVPGQPYFVDDEEEVSPGESGKTSYLVLSVAEKANGGIYSCVARNHASTQSANLTVTVGQEGTSVEGLETSHITGIVVGISVVIVALILVLCIMTLRCKPAHHREKNAIVLDDHPTLHSNTLDHPKKCNAQEQDYLCAAIEPIHKPNHLGHYHGVPTIDLDQYDAEYLPHGWKTQVVIELTKNEINYDGSTNRAEMNKDFDEHLSVKPLFGQSEREAEHRQQRFNDPESAPHVRTNEEDAVKGNGGGGGGNNSKNQSEEGDSGLELDGGGRELEVRSDGDSDREKLDEKNHRNHIQRFRVDQRDSSSPVDQQTTMSIGMLRSLQQHPKPGVQRKAAFSGTYEESTCSSSDPPTVPSSPQRPMGSYSLGTNLPMRRPAPNSNINTKVSLSLMVPTVLLTCPRGGRSASLDEEDGTDV